MKTFKEYLKDGTDFEKYSKAMNKRLPKITHNPKTDPYGKGPNPKPGKKDEKLDYLSKKITNKLRGNKISRMISNKRKAASDENI